MRKPGLIVKLALGICLAIVVASCAPIVRKHGYTPDDATLDEIVVGVDSRDTVADVVGPPTAAGVSRDDAWYYVSSRRQTRGWRATEIIDRQVVAVSFDGDGTVSNIERFTLEDGRVIALNRRVTDDNIKGISFLRQLLGNIGNFTTEQLLDN